MTIYRPTVAQEMGGDHSINKALQHIKKYIKVKIQEKNTLLSLIFCKVRRKGLLTSKISLVVGLFVALMLTS